MGVSVRSHLTHENENHSEHGYLQITSVVPSCTCGTDSISYTGHVTAPTIIN